MEKVPIPILAMPTKQSIKRKLRILVMFFLIKYSPENFAIHSIPLFLKLHQFGIQLSGGQAHDIVKVSF